jgi:hypothetical protein
MRVRADDVIGEGPARGEAPQVISLWASLHIPNTTNFTFMKKKFKNFMWKVFELNFIIFSIHRNGSEEMFFESKERVIGF